MIYEPQEDSYLLEKYVKKYAKGKVLDLGCGSGIQSLAALKNTPEVLAADINPEAVRYCKLQGINAVVSDLFSHIKDKFDILIFNPPYLPLDEEEPEDSRQITTGGKEGHELLEKFLQQARNYLLLKGIILLVCSSLTGDVEKLFTKYQYKIQILATESHFFEELKVYKLSCK